jgi:hypothetical protein
MQDIFSLRSTDGSARRGSLRLTHGVVETPCFMPVGTAATVKGSRRPKLRSAHSQIVLGKHLSSVAASRQRTIVEAGGLHRFMAWDGPILTDSGGFQVFSLGEPARGRRRRRHVSLAHRRQRSPLHAGERRRVSRSHSARRCDGARRLREAAGDARATRRVGAHDDRVGAALGSTRRRAIRRCFRDRAGRARSRTARAQRTRDRCARFSRLRDRRTLGRRDARGDVRTARASAAMLTRREAALSHGRRDGPRPIIMAVDCRDRSSSTASIRRAAAATGAR